MTDYLSLYDYLGKPAGGKIGQQVIKLAVDFNVPRNWRRIDNKVYKGNVLLYPKSFLDTLVFTETTVKLKNKRAIVVFSGGQDSVTCLHWALNRYEHVEAITFQYGQKHSIEITQAAEILQKNNVKQTVVNLDQSLGFLAESALLSHGNVSEINKYGLPSSFVPGRNGIFLYNAYIYGLKVGADALITGVCQTDFSGYPDCRRDFIDQLLKTMEMGVFGEANSGLQILTPLMYLNKAQTFKLAETENCLQEVVELSHTCYNGGRQYKFDWGYSNEKGTVEDPFCPACQLRANGWIEYKNMKK
jgi:7-cyano-7-deazaguanine synthase